MVLLQRQDFGPFHRGFLGGRELIRVQIVALERVNGFVSDIQRSTERDVMAGSVRARVERRSFQYHQHLRPHGQNTGHVFAKRRDDETEYRLRQLRRIRGDADCVSDPAEQFLGVLEYDGLLGRRLSIRRNFQ